MDQVHETDDVKDMRGLLLEVLKMQEMILHRLEEIETTINALRS